MPRRKGLYRVNLDEDGGKISFDEKFWEEEPAINGRTPLDANIEEILEDLRIGLYWIAAQRSIRH